MSVACLLIAGAAGAPLVEPSFTPGIDGDDLRIDLMRQATDFLPHL